MLEPRKALILPWLDLREPRTIGRVTFLSRKAALEAAGDVRAQLDARTAVFVENDAVGRHLRHSHTIRPLNATIAFLDDVSVEEARRAVNAFGFGTIAANEPPVSYANGTTFFSLVQSLGGEADFVGERRPRLHGSVLDGYHVGYVFDARPRNAEHFHYGADEVFLTALVVASEQDSALSEALSVVRMAASDSPDMEMVLALTLYAAATVRILTQPGLSDAHDPVLARVKSLLHPLIGMGTTGDKYEYHIARAWKSIRDDRNDWWHPTKMKKADFPFERQKIVTPHLIAFRMVQALIAARLVEMGVYAPAAASTMVRAIENWLGDIAENDQRSPDEAHSIRPYFRRIREKRGFDRAVAMLGEMRSAGHFPPAAGDSD